MSELTKEQKAGCFMVAVRFLLTTPLYYALMYLIMKHIDATDTMWILFWIWLPATLGLNLIADTVFNLFKGEK